VSDVISGKLSDHLGPLHLALGPKSWQNFAEVSIGN